MVAYKLYLADEISQQTWLKLSEAYRALWQENKAAKKKKAQGQGGPNYYTVRRHRVGDNLIALVERMMRSRALTTSKAAKILGVKPKNVQRLIETGQVA